MTAADFLILSLACWRVAYLVSHDQMPFGYLRDWIVRQRGYAKPVLSQQFGAWLYHFLGCIRCMSVWAAILTFLLWFTPLQPIVYIAAISGGALMLHKYTGWDFVQSNPNH